jgi:tetratricopeptide (TPR) repeat protein
MNKSKRNKFGLILVGLILLASAIVLHILYSLHLSTYHFNSTRFSEHFFNGFDALIEHDYVAAETYFNAALKEAEKESAENKYIADALLELGGTYILLKKYDKAEEAFQRQIAVAKKVYGPESNEVESGSLRIEEIHELRQNKND